MIRTFQGYVERRAESIIGLGVSAISSTPRMHWQNHAELATWEHDIAARQLPVERGYVLDDDDRARRALIGRLMCDGEADLSQIGREHAIDPDDYFAPELKKLGAIGELASYDAASHTIHTTKLGRLLVRNVCMVFDRYHKESGDEPKFSSTI